MFHAEAASELWFPTSKIYVSDDGTIVSPIGLGKGAIYSVESQVVAPTPTQLQDDSNRATLPTALEDSYLQLPHAYPRAEALAKSITAGDHTTYARVESLIAWIGTHTRYSLDIPPLPPGADTVNEFLFGNRVGFCEQISTSLAVMLRSIGIPTREVVGYVPGSYNPVTDLYQVRADDAHAWVQVWFPGFGWQSFDPTAVVPLANPSPGTTALHDLGAALGRHPVRARLRGGSSAAGSVAVLLRWRRVRPRTWTERIAESAERAGRRAGHPRLPAQTLTEYAAILDDTLGNGSRAWRQLASPVEASIYGGCEIPRDAQRKNGGPGQTSAKKASRPRTGVGRAPAACHRSRLSIAFFAAQASSRLRRDVRRLRDRAGISGSRSAPRARSSPWISSIFFKSSFVLCNEPSNSTIARPITTKGWGHWQSGSEHFPQLPTWHS